MKVTNHVEQDHKQVETTLSKMAVIMLPSDFQTLNKDTEEIVNRVAANLSNTTQVLIHTYRSYGDAFLFLKEHFADSNPNYILMTCHPTISLNSHYFQHWALKTLQKAIDRFARETNSQGIETLLAIPNTKMATDEAWCKDVEQKVSTMLSICHSQGGAGGQKAVAGDEKTGKDETNDESKESDKGKGKDKDNDNDRDSGLVSIINIENLDEFVTKIESLYHGGLTGYGNENGVYSGLDDEFDGWLNENEKIVRYFNDWQAAKQAGSDTFGTSWMKALIFYEQSMLIMASEDRVCTLTIGKTYKDCKFNRNNNDVVLEDTMDSVINIHGFLEECSMLLKKGDIAGFNKMMNGMLQGGLTCAQYNKKINKVEYMSTQAFLATTMGSVTDILKKESMVKIVDSLVLFVLEKNKALKLLELELGGNIEIQRGILCRILFFAIGFAGRQGIWPMINKDILSKAVALKQQLMNNDYICVAMSCLGRKLFILDNHPCNKGKGMKDDSASGPSDKFGRRSRRGQRG